MKISKILLLVSGVLELLLAIPVLGGWFVLATGWGALGFMFLLHLVTLIFAARERVPFYGPIAGLVTSVLAWIPFLGWFLHLASGIALIVNAFYDQSRSAGRTEQQRRFY
ncbi:hypothetical protein QWJ34_17915 [Saccharibacillus sp. CPCC 101409]|uniref:hypothetical protein n=1 Tax=Saccharibacillus sp. CPCC 101409 TaxID=3058041 RepID=UPI002672A599|nr:hypothetical protein [Saccharibacillus sp. CPCC 101409]MDO3411644.1 hypothetical protein [Saccharibacillus sp. CPCC 101409]